MLFISILICLFSFNLYYFLNDIEKMKNMGAYDIVEDISYFSFWRTIMSDNYALYILLTGSILITIPAIYNFFNQYHTGFFQNILMKKKYITYIKESIFKSWIKGALVIPIISIIIFIISYFLYQNSIIVNSDYTILYFPDAFIKNPYLGVFFATLNMLLYGILAINIGIILTKYIKHFILVIIATFLSFVGLALFSEVVVGGIFAYNLDNKNMMDGFSIFNSWRLDYVPNLWINSAVLLFYILFTLYIIYMVYRDKEKVILNYE